MNKSDLTVSISEKAALSKSAAQKVVEAIQESIYEALSADDKVTLVGFGTFAVVERSERKGRNPQTGAEMIITAKKVPKFSAGKVFKEAVK